MSLPIELDPEARDEISEAYDYYEAAKADRGDDFLAAVEIVFERIARMPKMHQIVHESVRRANVRDFPYSVFYIDETIRIRIVSVFHTSRDPQRWQSRI